MPSRFGLSPTAGTNSRLPDHEHGGRAARRGCSLPARRGIINNLRWFRTHAGLTQLALAGRSGVSRLTIYKIESGISFPTKETLEKIASVFHVEPEIVFDKPRPPRKQRPPKERLPIHCRRCHIQITGLMWDPEKPELIVKRMPRLAKVHSNGFFYHEDCLKEKIRIHKAFPFLSEK